MRTLMKIRIPMFNIFQNDDFLHYTSKVLVITMHLSLQQLIAFIIIVGVVSPTVSSQIAIVREDEERKPPASFLVGLVWDLYSALALQSKRINADRVEYKTKMAWIKLMNRGADQLRYKV